MMRYYILFVLMALPCAVLPLSSTGQADLPSVSFGNALSSDSAADAMLDFADNIPTRETSRP